jgi:hypothetical protein
VTIRGQFLYILKALPVCSCLHYYISIHERANKKTVAFGDFFEFKASKNVVLPKSCQFLVRTRLANLKKNCLFDIFLSMIIAL